MAKDKIIKGSVVVLLVYILLALVFYLVAGNELSYRTDQTNMVSMLDSTGELEVGKEVRQRFAVDGDELRSITLVTATYDRINTASLQISVVDMNGNVQGSLQTPMSGLNNGLSELNFAEPVIIESGEAYDLVFSTPDGVFGNTIALMYGNSIQLRQAVVPLEIKPDEQIRVNDTVLPGKLCVQLDFGKRLWFGECYWYLAGGLGVLLGGYCIYLAQLIKEGRSNIVLRLIAAFQRYGYLLRQLIARDFKTKYKRSILGIFWSFLNPLLTMSVQYVVFSTLFKSDIPNFALYLLIGIVCFNFFSEASTMALTSIVGNAALITKVYVPKYIYPVSRVLSSTVNLLLSLIPLFAVMLFTGAAVRPALLLLPFGLFCLLAFSLGVGMFLATTMVFFRDTQFLWGVVSMLWMYLTPIIYPESIIPESIMPLYKCNPLYHIVRFIRIIMMDGVSPEPKAYGLCLLASFIPLLLGAFIFKKQQDKFVLNL